MKIISVLLDWMYRLMLRHHRRSSIDAIRAKRNVFLGLGFNVGNYSNFDLSDGIGQLEIGKGTSCRNHFSLLMYSGAKCKIGSNVFFNNGCSINCLDSIEIGDNSMFGEGVRIYDHNHRYTMEGELTVERNGFTTASVIIGKDCWIGSNVTILKGVVIGDNVIIGANCLVHRSVPRNSIVKHGEQLTVYSR